MPILRNIALLATPVTGARQGMLKQVKDAALVWLGERIVWLGTESELPSEYRNELSYDAARGLVIPGLVDCHTHLAFGGWRENEFVLKCEGQSYETIARSGGGIISTVTQTRAADESELLARCLGFLEGMTCLGVTTVEVKTGYGLDLESELKLLRVYKTLAERSPLSIVITLLAAHTVPPEYKNDRQRYVDLVANEILPQAAKLNVARFCDIFVENIAFSNEEAKRILVVAKDLGFKLKLHVDQLTNGSGAILAAELGAVSADHLEYTDDSGIDALSQSATVAVSLPIASLYTRQPALNARKFLDKGVRVAVATDFNPGSAPSYHLPLAMMLGCTMNRLTPAESLCAGTIVAAEALCLGGHIGSLEQNKRADFVLLEAPSVDHWLYHFQANSCFATFKNGRMIYGALKQI